MKNRNASMGFILITILIDVIGFGLIIPILPSLLEEVLRVEPSEIILYGAGLTLAYGIFQFFFSPILGRLSDKYGRRPILLLSLFGLGLDYIILATTSSYWIFLLGRCIAGIFGASFSTANAYIADISKPSERAKNFGFVGAAFGVGFILGPVIGGYLSTEFGLRAPFYISACLALVNFMFGLFILPESHPKEKRRAFTLKGANPLGSLGFFKRYGLLRKLLPTYILILVSATAIQMIWAYYVKERYTWADNQIGLSLGFVGFMVALVQGGITGRLVKTWGLVKTLIAGLIFNGVGLVLFGLASEGWMVYAVLVPYAMGGIAGPALQSILSNEVDNSEQGELQGSIVGLQSASNLVGTALFFGIFFLLTNDVLGVYLPGGHLFFAALLILIAGLIALPTLRTYQPKSDEELELTVTGAREEPENN